MSLYQNWYDQFGQQRLGVSTTRAWTSTTVPVRLQFKKWATAMAVASEAPGRPRVSKVGDRWEVAYHATTYLMNGAA